MLWIPRALLNLPLHSEHFEYAQIWGVQPPVTIHHKWGGGDSVPRSKDAKTIVPGAASAQVGCSSLFTVGVGWGVLRGGGGVRPDT